MWPQQGYNAQQSHQQQGTAGAGMYGYGQANPPSTQGALYSSQQQQTGGYGYQQQGTAGGQQQQGQAGASSLLAQLLQQQASAGQTQQRTLTGQPTLSPQQAQQILQKLPPQQQQQLSILQAQLLQQQQQQQQQQQSAQSAGGAASILAALQQQLQQPQAQQPYQPSSSVSTNVPQMGGGRPGASASTIPTYGTGQPPQTGGAPLSGLGGANLAQLQAHLSALQQQSGASQQQLPQAQQPGAQAGNIAGLLSALLSGASAGAQASAPQQPQTLQSSYQPQPAYGQVQPQQLLQQLQPQQRQPQPAPQSVGRGMPPGGQYGSAPPQRHGAPSGSQPPPHYSRSQQAPLPSQGRGYPPYQSNAPRPPPYGATGSMGRGQHPPQQTPYQRRPPPSDFGSRRGPPPGPAPGPDRRGRREDIPPYRDYRGSQDRQHDYRQMSKRQRVSPTRQPGGRSPPRSRSISPIRDRPEQRELMRDRDREREREREREKRYICNIPKFSFATELRDYAELRRRYARMYIASDFSKSFSTWLHTLPLELTSPTHPTGELLLDKPIPFHIAPDSITSYDPYSTKPTKPVFKSEDDGNPVPTYTVNYQVKVMLLSGTPITPADEEVEASSTTSFTYLLNSLKFLVLKKDRSKLLAIGGPVDPALDGYGDPATDMSVLINAAIRHTKQQIDLDLSGCSTWIRFLDIHYARRDNILTDVTVFLVPSIWDIVPDEATFAQQWEQRELERLRLERDAEISRLEEARAEEQAKLEKHLASAAAAPPPQTEQSEMDVEQRKTEEPAAVPPESTEAKPSEGEGTTETKPTTESSEPSQSTAESGAATADTVVSKIEARIAELTAKIEQLQSQPLVVDRSNMPKEPQVIVSVHHDKSQNYKLKLISLDGLLDYDYDRDRWENTFEVSLFAENFHEMLLRCFGYQILQAIRNAPPKMPSTPTGKSSQAKTLGTEKKRPREDDQEPSEAAAKKPKLEETLTTESAPPLSEPQKPPAEQTKDEEPALHAEATTEISPTTIETPAANGIEDVEMTETTTTVETATAEAAPSTSVEPQPDATAPTEPIPEAPLGAEMGVGPTGEKDIAPETAVTENEVPDPVQPAVKTELRLIAPLLRAFHYYDKNRVGFLRSEDVELLVHNLGLCLTRVYVLDLLATVEEESILERKSLRIPYKRLVYEEVVIDESK